MLGVAAAEGALVQAWGAASQRRPVGEGMDVGAVEEFGRKPKPPDKARPKVDKSTVNY